MMANDTRGDEANEGFARVAELFGMQAPRPELRVVGDHERAPKETQGVDRPATIADYIGNDKVKLKVVMAVKAACKRNEQPGAILLVGPPGTGKTTLSYIVGNVLQADRDDKGDPEDLGTVKVHVVMGTSVDTTARMAVVLCKMKRGDVLFIDECHQMGLKSEEMLGLAMEDGLIFIPGGKGEEPEQRIIPPFTLVGATTLPGKLSRPLKDRFKTECMLKLYDVDELAEILRRKAAKDGWEVSDEMCLAMANTAWGTPRRVLKTWENVRDYAEVTGAEDITEDILTGALEVMGLDRHGLDEKDRHYLKSLHVARQGRRVGLNPAAEVSGIDKKEITTDIDPRLIRGGWLDSNGRGRCMSARAYEHLYPGMGIPPLRGQV